MTSTYVARNTFHRGTVRCAIGKSIRGGKGQGGPLKAEAADVIDALVAALREAKYWKHSETPDDVRERINAALVMARK